MAEINPPAYMQEGCYEAVQDRRLVTSLVCGQGVAFGACPEGSSLTALKVIDSPTGGMNVQVEAGSAFIQGDTIACQGMYHVVNDGPVDILLTASDPVSNRVDLIIAIIRDSQYSGAVDEWELTKVTGTPGAGAPAAPANSLTLAEVAVAANTGEIVAGNITDVRTSYTLCGDLADVDGLVAIVTFTSSGSFTKVTYPRARAVRVKTQAGGGAGGGAAITGSGTGAAGAGGGGGGYAEELLLMTALSASETVTVGAGGTVGAAGNNPGNAGGTSSFGAHLSATGGAGGTGSGAATNNTVGGGAGGVGSGGNINRTGQRGNTGRTAGGTPTGGNGGSSALGWGAESANNVNAGDGVAGVAYGGGGSGGVNRDTAGVANQTGGVGAIGIVIVEVYG